MSIEDTRMVAEEQIKKCLDALCIDPNMPEFNILDIACGDGKLLQELAKIYPLATYSGLSSEHVFAKARNPKADIRTGNVEAIPFPSSSKDLVISSWLYDYSVEFGWLRTFRMSRLLEEVHRVLKPDGLYIPIEYNPQKYFRSEHQQFISDNFRDVSQEHPPTTIFQKKALPK